MKLDQPTGKFQRLTIGTANNHWKSAIVGEFNIATGGSNATKYNGLMPNIGTSVSNSQWPPDRVDSRYQLSFLWTTCLWRARMSVLLTLAAGTGLRCGGRTNNTATGP